MSELHTNPTPDSRTQTHAPAPAASAGFTMGDPGPLGLAAFALTTFVLSVINAGLMDVTLKPVVFGLALVYGGGVQIIAGVLEFFKNNTFGGVAFCSYGAFWVSFWYLSTNPQYLAAAGPDAAKGVGLYLLGWTIFTAYMTVCVMRTNGVLIATFSVLVVAFAALCLGDFIGSSMLTRLGGWFGILAALGAWYASFAGITNQMAGKPVAPLWPRGAAH